MLQNTRAQKQLRELERQVIDAYKEETMDAWRQREHDWLKAVVDIKTHKTLDNPYAIASEQGTEHPYVLPYYSVELILYGYSEEALKRSSGDQPSAQGAQDGTPTPLSSPELSKLIEDGIALETIK